MVNILVTILDAKLSAALADPSLISSPMKGFMERATKLVEGEAKRIAPVDTGRYRSSISSKVDGNGKSGTVGPGVNYGNVIEWGHSPGIWPDTAGIERWASRHHFDNPRGASYAIAYTHLRRGRKGLQIMETALKNKIGDIRGTVGQMLNEVAARFRL
jgi:hypothetical protein